MMKPPMDQMVEVVLPGTKMRPPAPPRDQATTATASRMLMPVLQIGQSRPSWPTGLRVRFGPLCLWDSPRLPHRRATDPVGLTIRRAEDRVGHPISSTKEAGTLEALIKGAQGTSTIKGEGPTTALEEGIIMVLVDMEAVLSAAPTWEVEDDPTWEEEDPTWEEGDPTTVLGDSIMEEDMEETSTMDRQGLDLITDLRALDPTADLEDLTMVLEALVVALIMALEALEVALIMALEASVVALIMALVGLVADPTMAQGTSEAALSSAREDSTNLNTRKCISYFPFYWLILLFSVCKKVPLYFFPGRVV